MKKTEIAELYLQHLQNGTVEKIVELFNENGIVDSPLYGTKKASHFYRELQDDTSNSKLTLKGIFEQGNTNNFALYFTYHWTLKNNEIVEFDVVDIIQLDAANKIEKLKIIYDTVLSRELIRKLKE